MNELKELELTSALLKMAADKFGNHGCNDVEESIYDGWTIEERKKLVKEYEEYNGTPEEFDENFLHLPDFALMGFMAHKLANPIEPLVIQKNAEISRLIFEKLKSYSFGIDGVTDFGANKKEFTEIIQKTLTECISKNYNKD